MLATARFQTLLSGGALGLALSLVACSGASPAPTVDPEGPPVRVRTFPIEVKGEKELIDPGALSILAGRVCAVFTEVGGERMNCLTAEDLDRLVTAAAWRETLGSGCDEGQGVGCTDSITGLEFDVFVRGSLAEVDGELALDLSVLRANPPGRIASERIVASKPDALFEEIEPISRKFAWIILGAK